MLIRFTNTYKFDTQRSYNGEEIKISKIENL